MKNSLQLHLLLLLSPMLSGQVKAADLPETEIDALPPAETQSITTENQDVPTPEQLEINNTIVRYAEQVRQLEIENGAYNTALTEQLIGLGSAYSNAGNHTEALKVYERALHINRINQGLHNIDQIPILEKVIEANNRLGRYDTLTDKYGYMLWVYKRNFGDNSTELLPVIDRIANWHLHAFTQTLMPESTGHLVIAANLFSEAIETIKQTGGPDDPALIRPLYGIVNANFRLVEPYGHLQDIDMIMPRSTNPLLPSEFDRAPMVLRNRQMDLNYDREYLNNMIGDENYEATLVYNSYRSGRAALEKIIDIHLKNPDLPQASLAYALTLMGDWYQRFSKREAAIRYYRQAYMLLEQSDMDTLILNDLFGRPLSLDLLNFQQMIQAGIKRATPEGAMTDGGATPSAQDPSSTDLRETTYALVKFDVSSYGSVRNLEVIALNQDENVRFRRIAREKITSTPFRPRFEDGKPIDTENVRMLYMFVE